MTDLKLSYARLIPGNNSWTYLIYILTINKHLLDYKNKKNYKNSELRLDIYGRSMSDQNICAIAWYCDILQKI